MYKSLAHKYDNKFETSVTRSRRDGHKVELYVYIYIYIPYILYLKQITSEKSRRQTENTLV